MTPLAQSSGGLSMLVNTDLPEAQGASQTVQPSSALTEQ